MSNPAITVVGAGVLGLWQALLLSRAGHQVTLLDASTRPFDAAASRWAGAMISPDCEAESAPAIVRRLGHEGLSIWRSTYPGLINRGSLVVAAGRDRAELMRFGQRTKGGQKLDALGVAALEPAFAGRFTEAIHFPNEAHMETPRALEFLLGAAQQAGVTMKLGCKWDPSSHTDGTVVDCRGLDARDLLSDLRGVRGERLLLRSSELQLRQPVRLIHPRASFYIVPWSGGIHMVGATVIESEDAIGMTARSALELLGLAYALHPAFGEAEVVELSSGIRPALSDNIPRAIVRRRYILVNGAYRHGFLLAPVLAAAVTRFISFGETHELLQIEEDFDKP